VDWKRIIVGDAFRLPSKDFDYYRDHLLLWPILLFGIAAVTNFLRPQADHILGLKFLGVFTVSLLLAREKAILIGASLGFCFFQSLWALNIRHDPVGLWVALVTGPLLVLLFFSLRNYKPSYAAPRGGSTIATILLGFVSLGMSILLMRWIGH
jgi:hypothetical protein